MDHVAIDLGSRKSQLCVRNDDDCRKAAVVIVHKSGSPAVVWSGLDGLNPSRYYPGLGWAKTERVFAEHDGAHPWNPRTFIADSCRLFVAWKEDGTSLYAPYAAVLR